MSKEELIRKITSRKFLACFAGFCTALGAGVAGYVDGTTSLQGVLVSIVAYGLCEGVPDFAGALANALANKTITTTTLQASTSDKATIAKLLPSDEQKESEAA